MKKANFIKGIAILRSIFKNYEVDKDLYWTVLKGLPDDVYEKAIIEIIETQTELYPGTNLLAIIKEKAVNINYTAPYLAWQEVIGQLSFYEKPKYSNPIIDRVVNMIGWRELCNMELGDKYLRKQFFDMYNQKIKEDYKQQIGTNIKLIGDENEIKKDKTRD